MKVLVTGVGGFIASHVAEALLDEGHEVHGIDNFATGKPENVPHGVEFIAGDIRNFESEIKYDHVFHLAALARIQPSIKNPVKYHMANVVGTLNLLEYCRESGAKIIFSSSSSIYDDKEIPFTEDSPKNPKSPYALNKLECEQYVKLYNKVYDVDYTILRYFNVFGERQITEGAYAAVVGIFLNQKAEGKPLTIFGDGEKRRDFTYVKDVAQANLISMEHSGTFNVGHGNNTSINELADYVGGERTYLPERPGEAEVTLADNSALRKTGWKPTKSIGEWVNEVTS